MFGRCCHCFSSCWISIHFAKIIRDISPDEWLSLLKVTDVPKLAMAVQPNNREINIQPREARWCRHYDFAARICLLVNRNLVLLEIQEEAGRVRRLLRASVPLLRKQNAYSGVQ